MSTLLAFVPVAALLTITPGAATAMVVRNAARGGRRHALACTVGNEVGVIAWALLAAVGVAAVVATSAAIFAVVTLVGAGVLILIGIQSLRGHARRSSLRAPPSTRCATASSPASTLVRRHARTHSVRARPPGGAASSGRPARS